MNPIEAFQNWVAQVPDLLQPLIVGLAGAVPFIEGHGGAIIGIIGGMNPVVAIVAAMVGNFVCVAVVVAITSRARTALLQRQHERVAVSAGSDKAAEGETEPAEVSPRREKFQRAFDRYGVPGVSLLGPLLLPTHVTASMVAGTGVAPARVLFWQAIAITAWTLIFGVLISGVLTAVRA